jgi:histone-lysine N-methyltransferase SETMAR
VTNGVVLHHDNAELHVEAITIEMIQKLKFKLLPHPAYSPDLAPSDNPIFRFLKDVLRGSKFASGEEVQDTMYMWLCM